MPSLTFTQCIMSGFQQKIPRSTKKLKIQSEEIKQGSEPDKDVASGYDEDIFGIIRLGI